MLSSRPPATRATTLATVALLALLWLAGCAHNTQRNDWSQYEGPGAKYFQMEELEFPDVTDPVEPWNRSAAAFNRFLLAYLINPAAGTWGISIWKTSKTTS
jgi:ABC-type transporter lipoprotein component MlaA